MINTIITGDCLDVMDTLPSQSIDMILYDLPYGITERNKWDTVIPFGPLWEQYERLIKPKGAIVLTASQPFTTALISSNLKLFRYEWVWCKNTKTGFLNAHRQPLRQHENICVFYKRLPTYNPNTAPCNKPNKRGKIGTNYNENYPNSYTATEENYPTSLLCIPAEKRPLHPTQKPVALFEYLIKTYTNPGDLVLDNCIGSGTTAVAAINTGRRFIGIEKDTNYAEIARGRVAEALKGA